MGCSPATARHDSERIKGFACEAEPAPTLGRAMNAMGFGRWALPARSSSRTAKCCSSKVWQRY